MAEFIGLDVSVLMKGGLNINGRVAHIDKDTQLLSLLDVSMEVNGILQSFPSFQLAGGDILDLQLVKKSSKTSRSSSVAKPVIIQPIASSSAYMDPAIISMGDPVSIPMTRTPSQKSTTQPKIQTKQTSQKFPSKQVQVDEEEGEEEIDFSEMVKTATSKNQQRKPSRRKIIENPSSNIRQAHAYEPLIPEKKKQQSNQWSPQKKSPPKSFLQHPNKTKGMQNQQQQKQQQPQRKGKTEWASSHTVNYVEEFDFQANLAEFDKKQIFEEISRGDDTDPESLLVNLNRKKQPQIKLGIREMVLDDDGNGSEISEESDFQQQRAYFTTFGDIPVPCLVDGELDLLESLSVSKTGPNPDQQIENAARSICTLVLQAIGGSRRIKPSNHNPPPTIAVLVGECRAGAYGIAAARQLSNHDCNVVVCWIGGGRDDVGGLEAQNISSQLEILPFSGATVVDSSLELPNTITQPVDLIIDGLLGGRQGIQNVISEGGRKFKTVEVIRWAESSTAPKLSLECPSGLRASNKGLQINPKWTLAFGLPLHILYENKTLVGEVFLADVGVSKKLVHLIQDEVGDDSGKIKYLPPFLDKFLVGLKI